MEKIMELEELAEALKRHRAEGKKIVHCHGVFDLLHIGHIRYFEQARRMGDVLVVTVTPDRFVDKGPHRPAFTETYRAETIASLGYVDYVAINRWPTAEETLRLLRPDIYVKGSEFREITSDPTGKIGQEKKVVDEIGATLAFTEDIVFSSSNLINRYMSSFPRETQEYLNLFRDRYPLDEINGLIEKMSGLKVLVVGDTILDDYHYCDPIGKSSKDPIIVLKYQSNDLFAGGVLAVANHLANFAGAVDVLTVIGERDSHEDFIRSKLNENVNIDFVVQPGAPTTIKRRFIDGYTFNKMFEVYVMDDAGVPMQVENKVCGRLEGKLGGYDVALVADYGHGAVGAGMVRTLTERAPFLAVNTQANAGNRGFHTIAKYPRADYACIAEHEMRLEARDMVGEVHNMAAPVARRMGCSQFVVTRGRKGCLVWNKSEDLVEVPSFSIKTIDRVGAGDAFLSITALAARLGASNEVLGFIGNVAGSLAVEIVGNQKSIDKRSMEKYITSLMK